MKWLLALMALLAMAGPALAQPGKPAPRPVPQTRPAPPKSPFPPPAFKITIATEAAYPPFNYLDRKGLPAGFEMDLAQEACERMKAECEFVAAKWDDLIPQLLDRNVPSDNAARPKIDSQAQHVGDFRI